MAVSSNPPRLTGHETICMSDIARGIAIHQTAQRLGISERNVGFHIDSAINNWVRTVVAMRWPKPCHLVLSA